MSHYFKKRGFTQSGVEGFSLVELLVSLSIMGVILSVVVLNQRSYTEAASISNLADSMSLSISQAQAYGIAVREFTPGTADFSAAYGITVSTLDSGSNSAYLFFADRNGNQYYDGAWSCPVGGASECLERVNFSGGNYVESFCVVRTNGNDQCGTVSRVDITFLRPDPAARLKFFNSGGQEYSLPNTKGVRITLRSAGGLTRSIVVYDTGQVSVQ